MFDWVLNAPPPLDGYYLCGLSSLCVHIVIPECFQNVISRLQYTRFFYKQSQAEIGKKNQANAITQSIHVIIQK